MIVDCARYRAGVRYVEASSPADAVHLSHQAPGFVWLAVSQPTRAELQELRTGLGIPTRGIEAVVAGHRRPRLDRSGDCLVAVVKTVRYDEGTGQVDVGELALLVGPRYALLVSAEPDDIRRIRARIDRDPAVTALGPMAVLWAALDTVVDESERVADLLLERAERMEQSVFASDARDQSETIFLHHRRVDRLGRTVHQVLAMFDTLERGRPAESPEGVPALLGDAADRARRLSEEVEMLSGRLEGLLNANLSRVTVRQNVIVQKVSAWAAIAAAPTIVASIYGMNFRHMPELSWPLGYAYALTVMVAAVVGLHWNFRRLGWL